MGFGVASDRNSAQADSRGKKESIEWEWNQLEAPRNEERWLQRLRQ